MPAQETAFRNDKVVYWENVSSPDRYGQPRVSLPVQLNVRWDDKKTLGRDAKGNDVQLDATMIANRNLVVGSIVLHETLSYFVGTGSDSDENPEYYEVLTMDATPDLKNRFSAYVVGLGRYRNTLPEIVS